MSQGQGRDGAGVPCPGHGGWGQEWGEGYPLQVLARVPPPPLPPLHGRTKKVKALHSLVPGTQAVIKENYHSKLLFQKKLRICQKHLKLVILGTRSDPAVNGKIVAFIACEKTYLTFMGYIYLQIDIFNTNDN